MLRATLSDVPNVAGSGAGSAGTAALTLQRAEHRERERERRRDVAERMCEMLVTADVMLTGARGINQSEMTMLDHGGVAPAPAGLLDRRRVARAVARDLRVIYGERLRDVLLFGSWARGDAHPESDVDLLVVLDEVSSRQRELMRMSDVLWRHSLENDTVVAEIPVSEAEYRGLADPLLIRIRAEGISVA
jgi:predicted nucleotidyltransferase